MTHRRTGVYATMFTAAAIACAPVAGDPLEVFEIALKYVPQRSRFHECVRYALDVVGKAGNWLDAYESIHGRYGDWGHCRILQETGTLINTLRFAENIGHGIGIQVSQGNDTDSYGATAGSLLGAWFGPGLLEERWLAPFGDRIHTTLAGFHEQSLSAVAARMAALPARIAG
jgi:ADP-ribosylglycohydrolase